MLLLHHPLIEKKRIFKFFQQVHNFVNYLLIFIFRFFLDNFHWKRLIQFGRVAGLPRKVTHGYSFVAFFVIIIVIVILLKVVNNFTIIAFFFLPISFIFIVFILIAIVVFSAFFGGFRAFGRCRVFSIKGRRLSIFLLVSNELFIDFIVFQFKNYHNTMGVSRSNDENILVVLCGNCGF